MSGYGGFIAVEGIEAKSASYLTIPIGFYPPG
jgi:hypothetical protein